MSSIDDEIVRAKMRKLRVSTFADIFYEVVNDEAYADALPEDIFLAAVEEAYTQRQQRNIAKAITQAKFRYPDASLAEITRAEQRGINMRQLKRIAATNWRENPTNIHILAPTGTGKTYIACAIGIAACKAGYSVAYYRLDQLVGSDFQARRTRSAELAPRAPAQAVASLLCFERKKRPLQPAFNARFAPRAAACLRAWKGHPPYPKERHGLLRFLVRSVLA